MEDHIRDVFEEKARKGEGQFAIAFALLELADAQSACARELNRLGFNGAATEFGAMEALTMGIEKAGEMIADSVAQSKD